MFVVKQVSTRTLLQALENSVSDSRTDGRFLQLSGMSIDVDFARAEKSRIVRATVGDRTILSPESKTSSPPRSFTFTVAMVNFIADGFDGYTCFNGPDVETLVGVEGAMSDTGILLEILEEPPAGEEADFEHISRARKAVFDDSERDLPLVKPKIEGRIVGSNSCFSNPNYSILFYRP